MSCFCLHSRQLPLVPSPAPIEKDLLLARQPRPRHPCVHPIPSQRKVVVIDDDPTGTQTVRDVAVLTEWSVSSLMRELRQPHRGFYILTNSRALSPEAAERLARELGTSLREASRETGCELDLVSRADSTLRGHFPLETEALAAGFGQPFAGTILIPAFLAGGRYTVDDVHWVLDGTRLIPVGETEFARDPAFSFRHSHLRDYIFEKGGGRFPPEAVAAITLPDLRVGGPAHVARQLAGLTPGGVAFVNAAERNDFHLFTAALARPELQDRRFLFRTAADFAAALLGQLPPPPLPAPRIRGPANGRAGLIVAGSHIGKTSQQLEALFRTCPELRAVECDVTRLLTNDERVAEVTRCAAAINQSFAAGQSACVYTSRRLLAASDATTSLQLGSVVSQALVGIVRGLVQTPAWFIAKGGITSSDMATGALGIKRAWVLGPALPGVPVWRCGPESRWPDLPFVIFPGNVGSASSLGELVRKLLDSQR